MDNWKMDLCQRKLCNEIYEGQVNCGKINMEDYFIEAGNVVNTDNEIRINDVAKLYQFIKGKLNSLE